MWLQGLSGSRKRAAAAAPSTNTPLTSFLLPKQLARLPVGLGGFALDLGWDPREEAA